jgi:hypothetical protein
LFKFRENIIGDVPNRKLRSQLKVEVMYFRKGLRDLNLEIEK